MTRQASRRALVPGLLLALLAAAPGGAMAQEFYALWGGQHTASLDESTYSYSFEYLQNLNDNWFATFTWLNEGHVTNHHRDGHSGQLWYRWLSPERRFSLSAGVGPYRYYDTTTTEASEDSTDAHGWGVMGSVAANWYFHYPWVATLRYNYTWTSASITTSTYQIGLGYQFDPASRLGPVVPAASYGFADPEHSELTVMIGESIVNNFHSPTGAAWAIEYRYRYTPYVDFTATALDEGDSGVVKRRGLALEAWIGREFLDHRAEVGLGVGPYLAHDDDDRGGTTTVLGLLTMTASYRFSERWLVRYYWYRTLTTDGRDTDVMLLGLGYAF
jgi:Outer membrane protein beta-barrel domain